MKLNSVHRDWRPASVSFVLASVLAAFMLFLGVRGLVAPFVAAKGFGLPLVDVADAHWLQIKAGRDLSAGLSLVAFLALRNTRIMAVFLLAGAPIPLNDLLVSLASPLHDTAYALAVHGGATTLMVVLAASLLFQSSSASSRRDRAQLPRDTRSAASGTFEPVRHVARR